MLQFPKKGGSSYGTGIRLNKSRKNSDKENEENMCDKRSRYVGGIQPVGT